MLPATRISAIDTLSAALAPAAKPTLGERIVERYGGMLFSIALHLLAITFLLKWQVQRQLPEPRPEPRQIEITFTAPPAAMPPPPPVPQEPGPSEEEAERQPAPNDRAATSTVVDEENPMLDPMVAAPQDRAEELDTPQQEQEPEPEPAEAAESEPLEVAVEADPIADAIDEMKRDDESELPLSAYQKQLTREELDFIREQEEALKRELAEFDEKLADPATRAQEVILNSAARQAFVDTAGAADGVVRTMEFRGVPEPLLERVLKRNGIETVYRQIDEPTRSDTNISGVRTDSTVYRAEQVLQPGIYQMMFMSQKALRRLSQLEKEWMARRRLKPEDILLKSVVYGIDRVGEQGYWDIVILDIDYQKLSGGPPARGAVVTSPLDKAFAE